MSKPRALVSCTVLSVQDSCFLYPCCRSCLCKLKLDSNGAFCAKCGYTCGSHVDYRYRLSLKVSRNKDIFGATIFGGCLNPFFGIAAGDLQKFIKSEELDAAHTVQQLLVKAVEDCFIGKSVILELKVPQDFAKTSSLTGQLVAWQIISPHVFLMDCTVVTYFKALLQERSKSESTNQSKHIHAEELSSFDHTPPSCAMWDSQPSSEEFRISSIWRSPGLCFQTEESSHDSSQHPRDYGSKILCNRSQVQSLNYTQCELKEETPDSPRNVLYSSCDMFSSLAHCNVSTSGASTNMQRTLFCKKFFEITTSEKCLTDNALFHEMSLYSYSNPKISLNLEHSTISESVEKLGMFEHEESGILDKKGHNSEKTVEMMLDKHTCLWNDHAVPSYKAQVILCGKISTTPIHNINTVLQEKDSKYSDIKMKNKSIPKCMKLIPPGIIANKRLAFSKKKEYVSKSEPSVPLCPANHDKNRYFRHQEQSSDHSVNCTAKQELIVCDGNGQKYNCSGDLFVSGHSGLDMNVSDVTDAAKNNELCVTTKDPEFFSPCLQSTPVSHLKMLNEPKKVQYLKCFLHESDLLNSKCELSANEWSKDLFDS